MYGYVGFSSKNAEQLPLRGEFLLKENPRMISWANMENIKKGLIHELTLSRTLSFSPAIDKISQKLSV